MSDVRCWKSRFLGLICIGSHVLLSSHAFVFSRRHWAWASIQKKFFHKTITSISRSEVLKYFQNDKVSFSYIFKLLLLLLLWIDHNTEWVKFEGENLFTTNESFGTAVSLVFRRCNSFKYLPTPKKISTSKLYSGRFSIRKFFTINE